ncbi:MAG: hypothetical protein GY884_19945 [Proteobacteria bacterium]|nr:hypothetical protein [Pseudomonadota bacterium]
MGDGSSSTVIDGGTDAALTVDGEESSISGFTLTGQLVYGQAFGLACDGGTVALDAVRVADGTAPTNHSGYGLQFESCEATIDDLVVEDNDYVGPLLAVKGSGSLVARHMVFRDNTYATPGYSGGANLLVVADGPDVEISNSVFHDNEVNEGAIELTAYSGTVWVHNIVVYDNTEDSTTDNVLYMYGTAEVQNSVFASNSSRRGRMGPARSTTTTCTTTAPTARARSAGRATSTRTRSSTTRALATSR